MYLRYGNYSHDADTCTFTINASVQEDESGNPFEVNYTWNIEGQIQGADQPTVVENFRLLETAYATWFQDLGFFTDAGVSTHTLLNSGSISGVKIVGPPSYPRGDGAQLSTFRDFTITATASYPAYGTANVLRSYNESLSFSGGGPERAVIECANVPPQEQIIKSYTMRTARQSGSAVGLFAYPTIPAPLFPGKERIVSDPPGNPVKGSPKRRNGKLVDWPISWSYEFISGTPIDGSPNPWPGR